MTPPLHSTQLLSTSPRPSPSLNEPVKVSQMPPPPQASNQATKQRSSCLPLPVLHCCFLPPPSITPYLQYLTFPCSWARLHARALASTV